jgi:hypothetical protein
MIYKNMSSGHLQVLKEMSDCNKSDSWDMLDDDVTKTKNIHKIA